MLLQFNPLYTLNINNIFKATMPEVTQLPTI